MHSVMNTEQVVKTSLTAPRAGSLLSADIARGLSIDDRVNGLERAQNPDRIRCVEIDGKHRGGSHNPMAGNFDAIVES